MAFAFRNEGGGQPVTFLLQISARGKKGMRFTMGYDATTHSNEPVCEIISLLFSFIFM